LRPERSCSKERAQGLSESNHQKGGKNIPPFFVWLH
jgi:hypothetical protein